MFKEQLSVGNQGHDTGLYSKVECYFSSDPLTFTLLVVCGRVTTLPQETVTLAPMLHCQAVYWLPEVCDFSRRIRFIPGPDMVNTLMTNYTNLKNHPSQTNTHTDQYCPSALKVEALYVFMA